MKEARSRCSSRISKYVDRWIYCISSTIVGLVHVFNPEMVILEGGVSEQKELFVNRVRDIILKKVMPNFAKGLSIEAATSGNNAEMIGAVKLLIDRQNSNI